MKLFRSGPGQDFKDPDTGVQWLDQTRLSAQLSMICEKRYMYHIGSLGK